MAIAFVGASTLAHGAGNLTITPHASTASGNAILAVISSADTNAITFPALGPNFRAAGAKSTGTTGAVTVSAPAGVAVGDLEILISATISGNTVSITSNGGSAWTSLGSSTCTSGEDLFVWYRIRQSGDGNPQVTPSGDHSISVRLAYIDGSFDPTTPIDNWTTGNENTSDTSFSWAPGYSTSVDNCRVLTISTSGVDSNTAQVPVCTDASLTNLASRTNVETTSGLGGGFGCTEGTLVTAGTIGTFACTYTSASPKAYASFAIRPDPDDTPWTILVDDTNSTQRTVIAGRVAGASIGPSLVTVGGSNTHVGQFFTFSGNDTSNPFPTIGTPHHDTGSGGSGTGHADSIDPVNTGSGIIYVETLRGGSTDGGGSNYYSSWSGSNPSLTEIADSTGVDVTNEASLGVSWGTTSDGSATDAKTVALGTGLSTGTWVATGVLIELAPPSGGGHNIDVGQVTETDLAQAITGRKLRSIGQPSETDLAQALTIRKLRSIGLNSETDLAQPLTARKLRSIGLVTETDLAQPITRGGTAHNIAVGIVVETDTAFGMTIRKLRSIGQPTETDLAQPISRQKLRGIGFVTETDLAQPISGRKLRGMGLVSETDLAQHLTAQKRKTLGLTTETDLAQPLSGRKTQTLGLVVELDSALPITRAGVAEVVKQIHRWFLTKPGWY